MKMKTTLIIVAFVAVVGAGAYWQKTTKAPIMSNERQMVTDEVVFNDTEGKLKAAAFTGKLEEVNVGCFADAECYVVVDGKHVTTTMGWSQAVVGTVQGVEGFGDLEGHIGEEVEVYAQDKGDGTYTLYGSTGFYVKLLSK